MVSKRSNGVFSALLFLLGTTTWAMPGMLIQPFDRAETGVPYPDAVKRWLSSVAQISVKDDSLGNGIFLSPKHLVTAAHVIEQSLDKYTVMTSMTPQAGLKGRKITQRKYRIKDILWKDTELDLAVLEIRAPYSPDFILPEDLFRHPPIEKILYAGYYWNGLLWINRDCLWSEHSDNKNAVKIQREDATVTYPPGTLGLMVCPVEKGLSGSLIVGLSEGRFYPLGILSIGMWINRRLEERREPGLIGKNPGAPNIEISAPVTQLVAGGEGLATMLLAVRLDRPIWEKKPEIWKAVVDEAQRAEKGPEGSAGPAIQESMREEDL